MKSSWPAWRMSSKFTHVRSTRKIQWCASMKARFSSYGKCANPCRARQDGPGARIVNTSAAASLKSAMICQPAAGLRKCLVMEHRKKADFAAVCQELDRMFPKAQMITLVCDRLEHAHQGRAVHHIFTRRGAPTDQENRDQAHPQAWLMAEHRRAGVRSPGPHGLQKKDRQ